MGKKEKELTTKGAPQSQYTAIGDPTKNTKSEKGAKEDKEKKPPA